MNSIQKELCSARTPILIGPEVFCEQAVGGISKSICEMLKYYPGSLPTLGTLYTFNVHLNTLRGTIPPELPQNSKEMQQKVITTVRDASYMHTGLLLRYGGVKVYHPSYYTRRLQGVGDAKVVLTIHDMINEMDDPKSPESYNKQTWVDRADKFICVSETTKKRFQKYYNILDSKIEVIYHGVNFNAPVKNKSMFPFKYLLYVGNRMGTKNFEGMIHQLYDILNTHKDIHLVCTGGGEFTPGEIKLLSTYCLLDRCHQQITTDAYIPTLYRYAEAFIFPSTDEGFGMPLLESYAYGCPAILNEHCEVFHELAGNCGIYYNDNLSETLDRVLHEDREAIVKKQLEHAHKFSWSECAYQHKQIYDSLL